MESDSYIIYETVMHSFDGPVISNVSCAGGENSLVVGWDTDVAADGFVEYSTDSGLAGAKEQGSSLKNSSSKSVTVTGLSDATTYYYRVKSTRVNGGTSVDSTIRSCATTAGSAPPAPAAASSGGGVLIIDKTDKIAPEITALSVTEITNEAAVISWATDEEATSFVEYGKTPAYGGVYGAWASTTSHRVSLMSLEPSTTYHLRALSSDPSGNVARSEDIIIITGLGVVEEDETEPELPAEDEEEGPPETILAAASEKLIELLNRFSGQVSLNFLEENLTAQYGSIRDLANLIPAPILSGEPRVEAEATQATIYWTSDKPANSLVAIAPESRYAPEQSEPYLEIVGRSDEFVLDHAVTVYGLEPDTIYHFQLRSAPALGPAGVSRDFTFRTSLEALEISSFFWQIDNTETVVFKWITNKEANSAVTIAPYRGNALSVEEAKTTRDNSMTSIHEIMVAEFAEGTTYSVEIASQDASGNLATELLPRFTTSEDDRPPEISHIQTDSTIFVDRGSKIQTIISWRTNEPSTSRVYFQEGVIAGEKELAESTDLNTDYSKEHVIVITKFKPGIVYSFRAESIDSGGNSSISPVHTFMTPKKKESIFQVIMRILEETFGWIKKLT